MEYFLYSIEENSLLDNLNIKLLWVIKNYLMVKMNGLLHKMWN